MCRTRFVALLENSRHPGNQKRRKADTYGHYSAVALGVWVSCNRSVLFRQFPDRALYGLLRNLPYRVQSIRLGVGYSTIIGGILTYATLSMLAAERSI